MDRFMARVRVRDVPLQGHERHREGMLPLPHYPVARVRPSLPGTHVEVTALVRAVVVMPIATDCRECRLRHSCKVRFSVQVQVTVRDRASHGCRT